MTARLKGNKRAAIMGKVGVVSGLVVWSDKGRLRRLQNVHFLFVNYIQVRCSSKQIQSNPLQRHSLFVAICGGRSRVEVKNSAL